jgi:hypothetical protein
MQNIKLLDKILTSLSKKALPEATIKNKHELNYSAFADIVLPSTKDNKDPEIFRIAVIKHNQKN